MASTNAAVQASAAPRPLHLKIMLSPLALMGMLFGALVSAVLIEWVGMATRFWDEPGAEHARQTLIQDILYLNADFTRSALGVSPVELAARASTSVSRSISDTVERLQLPTLYAQLSEAGLSRYIRLPSLGGERRAANSDISHRLSAQSEQAMQVFLTYVDAAIYSVQTVVVRVIVAVLTLPAYLLIGLACLLDGVVARDLRKFTAANESAFAYHRYRPWARRFFVAGWYLYIAWPGSIHPNVVFVPSALLVGLAVFNSAKWFKKFF